MHQLDHLITKKIRSTYGRRIFSPIVYCIFLIIIWFYTPMQSLIRPLVVSEQARISDLAANGSRYISTTLHDLNFTGYTQSRLGFVTDKRSVIFICNGVSENHLHFLKS